MTSSQNQNTPQQPRNRQSIESQYFMSASSGLNYDDSNSSSSSSCNSDDDYDDENSMNNNNNNNNDLEGTIEVKHENEDNTPIQDQSNTTERLLELVKTDSDVPLATFRSPRDIQEEEEEENDDYNSSHYENNSTSALEENNSTDEKELSSPIQFERQNSSLDYLVEASSKPTTLQQKMVNDIIPDPMLSDSDIEEVLQSEQHTQNHHDDVELNSNALKDNDQSVDDNNNTPKKIKDDENNHKSPSPGSSHSVASVTSWSSRQYKITNTDNGKTYDIRDLEDVKLDDDKDTLEMRYSLFPSKFELIDLHSKRKLNTYDENGIDENGNEAFSPLKETREFTREIMHKSTRAVAKASKKISKGFMKKNKSDSVSSSIIVDNGQPVEPFPSETLPTDVEGKKHDRNESKKKEKMKQIWLTHKKKQTSKLPALAIPKNTLPVRCVNKSKVSSDFNPMILITTFANAHDGPIWKAEFSYDGNYLATAGSDGVLNIWQVAPSREQLKSMKMKEWFHRVDDCWTGKWSDEDDTSHNDDQFLQTVKSEVDAIGTEIKLLSPKPIQSFKEHTQDIVDISWSNTGFLLSASMDKTVQLWHPSKSKSLRTFQHPEEVTSVSFHPDEDRYFLSGGYDKKLRIWNIPDGRVVQWQQAHNIITTASYQPDGKKIAAGFIDGKVVFYSVDDNLKYFTEMICKNRNKKFGQKVSGLSYTNLQNLSQEKINKSEKEKKKKTKLKKAAKYVKNLATSKRKKQQHEQVLITTNDSRLRLVGLNDFCMVRKYKGHSNAAMQLRARFSESGDFIIVGSETGKVVIWNTATRRNPLNINVTGLNMYDKVKAFECFEGSKANPPIVTEALFAPRSTTKAAILDSGLFSSLNSLDRVRHDFSSAMVVTCDYGGTIRVFMRRSSFDAVVQAAGPAGSL